MKKLHKKIMDEWWIYVKKCLVNFHHLTPRSAAQRTRRTREDYAKHKVGHKFGIFYHEEPFVQANCIMGKDIVLSNEEYRKRYIDEILFNGENNEQI